MPRLAISSLTTTSRGLRIGISFAALGLTAIVVVIATLYLRDINRAYQRITVGSKLIPSPYGNIEYSDGGSGPDVLVIHGSGGGYDNGELLARVVLGNQFHWISPSRFGYLRSTFRPGATFDDQAHAYAHLLDYLGIKKVAVIAISHGGPSALLFAVLYPERVSSLSLLSVGVASSTAADQVQANYQGDMLVKIFRYDILYWSVAKLFNKQFLRLMGVTDAVITQLTVEQRQLADQVIEQMNPVSPRTAGVVFDNLAAMPNARVGAIRAPTLILHARDDTLQLYRNAEFAASAIPGARLLSFDRGGHLLMVVEQATIRTLVHEHVLGHVGK